MSEENRNLPQVTIQDVMNVEFNFLEESLYNHIRLRSRKSDSKYEKISAFFKSAKIATKFGKLQMFIFGY